MTGLTDFITEARWEDIFTLWFVLVDDAYQALERHFGRWRRRGPQPKFADSEVMTVGLIVDTWFDGDEATGLAFVRQYHLNLFPALPANGHFNTRRRAIRLIVEQIRRCLVNSFGLIDVDDNVRLIDSAPVLACQYGRASRCQSVAGPDALRVGVNAVKKARCFGFRLQTTITARQVVDDWLLAPAGRNDGKMMLPLLTDRADLHVFGDNAYHDPSERQVLQLHHNIHIWAVPRKDSRFIHWPETVRRWVKRLRLRIETAFSVLQTVFHIQLPGSRSLTGLVTRTASRLLAYSLCFITAPLFATGQLETITPN